MDVLRNFDYAMSRLLGRENFRCWRDYERFRQLENGEDGEEADDTALDKNKNKIVHSPTPSDNYHDNDLDTQGHHYGNQDESEAPAGKKMTREVPQKAEKYISPEEKVAAILREIQSATTNATNVSTHKNGAQSGSHGDGKSRSSSNKAEEARIAELLNRGDTAVIYPEPVSDGEEQQNNEGSANDEEIILKCMHCPQTFLRAIVLRDHMREVHADKPLKFMCPKCDETFHQKSQLDKHLTLHSPTSQVCHTCNKTFANVYRLQRHMISHNESTDLRKFKCPECGKAFKFKHHLKEHIRIHSGEKPFVCMNCGKRFSHSGSFSSHTTSKKCWGLSATRTRDGNQSQSPNQTSHTQSVSASTSAGSFPAKVSSAAQSSSREESTTVPTPSSQHIPQLYAQQRGLNPFFYPPQMFATPDGFLHPMYSSMPHHPAMALPGLTLSSIAAAASKERGHSSHGSHNASHPSVSSLSSAGRSTRSMSPHSQSTRSFSPHSRSERSVSPGSVFSMSSPPATPSRRSVTPVYQRPDATSTPIKEAASTSSTASNQPDQLSPDVNSNTKLLKNKEESKKEVPEVQTNRDASNSEIPEVAHKAPERRSSSESMSKDKLACQYCHDIFESPVTLHQHERYLCKLNKEILQHRAVVETCQSPHSTVSDISHVESTTNGSGSTMSDDEEVEELYKDADSSLDEKNMRIRTQFTEEQQQYLRSQYLINPRPRKFELIRMGNKIGFPKRVVQVWFQNMRARERKYGREATSASNFMRQDSRETAEFTKSYPYIPNVPKPFNNLLATPKPVSPQAVATTEVQKTGKAGESPLDLSTRKSPPLAHGGSGSRQSTPESFHDTGALNLSLKKEPSEDHEYEMADKNSNTLSNTEKSIDISNKDGNASIKLCEEKKLDGTEVEGKDGEESNEVNGNTDNQSEHSLNKDMMDEMGDNRKAPNAGNINDNDDDDDERENSVGGRLQEVDLSEQVQKSFQDSPIFKYMQQEGMFMNKQLSHLPVTMASSYALLQSQFLQQTMASVLHMPHCQPGVELNIPQASKSTSLLFDTSRHSESAPVRPLSAVSTLSTDTSCTSTSTSSSATSPAAFSYQGTDHQGCAMSRHPSHLNQSLNPNAPYSPTATGHPSHLEDTHNLTTLAEAAQQAATILSGKPKRVRKKTWRQVESEEAQLDLDDSQSTDDESQPTRKKRKSWKGHRVDREEGMYACDQCNKLFSKQSSLARHKYEHSGARPFACDMCSKSFKHKHHLTEHKRLHSGEKPFQCKKCGKRFSHSGSFSQHMNHRYNYCSPHKTSDGDNDGELSAQDSP